MKVLVVGRGGREHALVRKIKESPKVEKIFCATGNAGIAHDAELVNIRAEDIGDLLKFAKKQKIDLTVVGPEVALTEGIVDAFEKAGLKVFGPQKSAAQLEVSKAFAKKLMKKYKIPTAKFGVFEDQESAFRYFEQNSPPFAVKADGLDSGKGIIIAQDEITAQLAVSVILKDRAFGDAGKKVIIEELIGGEEICVVAFTDGKRVLGATSVEVYKRALDGDRGPFTGGMGAVSPHPSGNDAVMEAVLDGTTEGRGLAA